MRKNIRIPHFVEDLFGVVFTVKYTFISFCSLTVIACAASFNL